jgi:hypothetical protein
MSARGESDIPAQRREAADAADEMEMESSDSEEAAV